jgi:uncharacterized protein YjbI with pentapeptide repeats
MNIDRRHLLFAAGAVATTTCQPAYGHRRAKRVSQAELDEAIRLHGMWLTDINIGQRCMFGGRDLSGLQFGVLGGEPINLSGADFAQADLSRTVADDILVHHCNFNGAKFDGGRWRRPVFVYADLRRVSAKGVIWGTPGRRGSAIRSPADFSHTVLHDADLTEARICGSFYGTKLTRASLVRANLSLSDFLGPSHYEMSFSGANLSGAKLRHCYISSASFSNADCSGADFSHCVISEVAMKNCNLQGALFHKTEFERAVFSPHRISDPELRRIITGDV